MQKKISGDTYFIINSLTVGGAEKQAILLGKKLKFKKMYTLFPTNPPILNGLHITHLYPSWLPTHFIFKAIFSFFYGIYFSCIFKKNDVVISFLEISNIINLISSHLLSRHKTILSIRSNPSQHYKGLKKYIFSSIIKMFYNKANIIVVNSTGVKEELIKKFNIDNNKIRVIANLININEIINSSKENISSEENLLFKNPTLVHLGRFDPAKGHVHLITIFKKVVESHPQCKLICIGDGILFDKIINYAKEIKLECFVYGITEWDISRQQVFFLGNRKNPYSYLTRATLFVFPSLWEGLPNSILEAMALGIPVISADCEYGPRDILLDKEYHYGIMIPPFSNDHEKNKNFHYDLWRKEITYLLDHEKIRKKYKELSFLRSRNYYCSIICKKWKDVINENFF